MDSRQRTLDIDMAEWRDESLGCSKTGTLAQKTKGRQRILPTDWSATGRLIIPQVRDRWFKSSPRNQFLARWRHLTASTFYEIPEADFTLGYPAMSGEGSNNTTRGNHVGQRGAVLGHLFGKVTSRRFQRREDWKTVYSNKKAGTDCFIF